ncbi:MAG: L-rhamnose mutarotase [Asticcacaulis sp.]|nr:L-rhamnose mutarotase [Asticcacaulis sp.]
MSDKLYYALDLKDDPVLIERYKAWHAPGAVPEAVNASIRNAGIEALEIFLVGNRMVMVLTPGPGFDPVAKAAADAASSDVQAWEALMWQFQQTLPFAPEGEKWLPMERIYALSEQV